MIDTEIDIKCPNCGDNISNDGEDIVENMLYVKGYCYNCKSYYDLDYRLDFTLVKFKKDMN